MERIRKINIEGLMNLLGDMWDRGVDYVDISGRQNEGEGEDVLSLSFCREYMDEEYRHLFEEMGEEDPDNQPFKENNNIEIKLSDEDLNNLI